jgi:hypothetical protein
VRVVLVVVAGTIVDPLVVVAVVAVVVGAAVVCGPAVDPPQDVTTTAPTARTTIAVQRPTTSPFYHALFRRDRAEHTVAMNV